jgi:hypothetical protein
MLPISHLSGFCPSLSYLGPSAPRNAQLSPCSLLLPAETVTECGLLSVVPTLGQRVPFPTALHHTAAAREQWRQSGFDGCPAQLPRALPVP